MKIHPMKKCITFLIITTMLLSIVPMPMFSVTATEETAATTDAQTVDDTEVLEKRGKFEKHFKQADGTVKAILYPEPVHYLDSQNVWQEVDNTIALNANGTKYIGGSGDFRAELGSVTKMTSGVLSIEWGAKAVIDNEKTIVEAIPNITATGASAMNNVFSNANVGVIASTDKLGGVNALGRITSSNPQKNVITSSSIVQEKITQNTTVLKSQGLDGYEVTYKLNGLIPVLTENNAITLNDSNGNAVYIVTPLLVVDKEKNALIDYTVDVSVSNDMANVVYTMEESAGSSVVSIENTVTTAIYTDAIYDTTDIGTTMPDSYWSSNIEVGCADYYITNTDAERMRHTGYIKFTSLPAVSRIGGGENIESIKIELKARNYVNNDTYETAIYQTGPWLTGGETRPSGSTLKYVYEKTFENSYDYNAPDGYISVDGGGVYSFDVTHLIDNYSVDEFFFAFAYCSKSENAETRAAQNAAMETNVNEKVLFYSKEGASLAGNLSYAPVLEVVYTPVDYNFMVKSAKDQGKYLDLTSEGDLCLKATEQYKRENLWSFEKAPITSESESNTYYIRTSESVYLNNAYGNMQGLPSSFDRSIKYLALSDDKSEICLTSNKTDNAKWVVEQQTDGSYLIYNEFTQNNATARRYLFHGGEQTLLPATVNVNAYWTFTRCDIISGKVYTIKSMAENKYVSVYHGYDHSMTDLTMEDTTNRGAYNHQTFRIEYLPERDAYKFRTMVCMNGWYRPIDIIRSSGSLETGFRTQIYNDSTDGITGNESCQLFDILTVDTRSNVCYVASSTVTDQYLVYHNNDVLIKEKDSVDQENQTWLLEEYTGYYEEYYRSLNWEFPVKDGSGDGYTDAPWQFLSSKAYRSISNGSSDHAGIDITFSQNTLLTSPFDGRITYYNTQITGARGYYVVIESNYNVCGTNTKIKVLLQHLNEPISTTISNIPSADQLDETPYYVDTDTVIGKIGGSGMKAVYDENGNVSYYTPSLYAYGTHMHYAVIVDGSNTSNFLNSIDPLLFHNREDFYYFS